jgi:hypothetical protein
LLSGRRRHADEQCNQHRQKNAHRGPPGFGMMITRQIPSHYARR